MSTPSNDFIYRKEFAGNFRGESEPVPVRINTRLEVRMGLTAAEVQAYRSRPYERPPYAFTSGGNLPLHPSLQAMGRHYFTW